MPLKVLHIGKYFPPYAGGMETFLKDLMVAQKSNGIEPAALVHQSEVSLRSSQETYSVGDQKFPVWRAAVWAKLVFAPLSPTFPWLIRRLIKQHKPDILHLHVPNLSAFWCLLLPSARKIPWVIQWQSDVVASDHSLGLRALYRFYRPFERALLRRSRAVIVASPPYLESSLPLSDFKNKCRVVPLGIADRPLPLPEARSSLDRPSLRVLGVGRLTYYKGFEYLIRALELVDDVELDLVGTGELEGELRKLAADLGVEHKVRFRGHVGNEELAHLEQSCDCLCLPSIERTEAYGLVLLEAMRAAKATIISEIPGSGMGWIVDHDETGIHVPPQDPQELASALRHFRDNRDKLALLGNNGRAKFVRLFSIECSEVGVAQTYREILD